MSAENDIVTTCLALVQNLTADGCAEKQSLDAAKGALDQAKSLALPTEMICNGSNLTISAEKGLTATCSVKSDLTTFVSDTYTAATDSAGNYAATVKLTNGKTQDFVWRKGDKGMSGTDKRKKESAKVPGSWYYNDFKPGGFKVWGGSSAGVSGSATGVSAAVTGASLGVSVVSISCSGATFSLWGLVIKCIAKFFPATTYSLDFVNVKSLARAKAVLNLMFNFKMHANLRKICANNLQS